MSKRNHISTLFLSLLMPLGLWNVYAQNVDLESLGKGKFKSFNTETWANITHQKFVNQFKAYLSNSEITHIDDLNYVINLSKVENIDVVKNAFKDLFTSRKTEIFNAIWDNPGLRNSLFDLSNYPPNLNQTQLKEMMSADFNVLVNNTQSSLYQFIKVE